MISKDITFDEFVILHYRKESPICDDTRNKSVLEKVEIRGVKF